MKPTYANIELACFKKPTQFRMNLCINTKLQSRGKVTSKNVAASACLAVANLRRRMSEATTADTAVVYLPVAAPKATRATVKLVR